MNCTEIPQQRCLRNGARTLSLRECISVLIESGEAFDLASDLLERPGVGLPESECARAFYLAMEVSPLAHLQGIRGLSESDQAKILAAFEIARRYSVYRAEKERRGPTGPALTGLAREALSKVTAEWRAEAQEWLGFVPCFKSRQVGSLCIVERGVRTHVNIETVELFARILALRPQGVFLFHNHPSGELKPSGPDREITENVDHLAGQLGIRLLGHGIVSAHGETWINPCGRVRYDRDSGLS